MTIPNVDDVKSATEAQGQAIAWQAWASEQSLSYSELSEWRNYFEALAQKFNLTDEFKENGVI